MFTSGESIIKSCGKCYHLNYSIRNTKPELYCNYTDFSVKKKKSQNYAKSPVQGILVAEMFRWISCSLTTNIFVIYLFLRFVLFFCRTLLMCMTKLLFGQLHIDDGSATGFRVVLSMNTDPAVHRRLL